MPIAIEEHDIDRESHEEHVHPHERLQPPRLEQHPHVGIKTVAPQQSTTFTAETACVLEPGAQDCAARLIEGQKNRNNLSTS